MANNRIETRLLLRYATYNQWMNSDVILMPGEAAVAYFPRLNTLENTDDEPAYTPPAIGLKIGDGESYFDELPWVQAIAADVYHWAKASEKPTYAATEITGLAEFIANQGGGGGSGGGSGSSSSYRIVYNSNTKKYVLQYYDAEHDEWVDTSSEINLADILNRIDTIERWANGARTKLGNIEVPIAEYIYEEVLSYMDSLDYNDMEQPHQFVTSVVETNGKIAVTRSIISASDITSGVFSTEQGGTGLTRVEEDELLIGSANGTITKRRFTTEIEDNRNVFVTAGAVIDYVLSQTAGLKGAMHFIGESSAVITNGSRVDPQIRGYTFRDAEPGDVILYNSAEFVWTGDEWHLLGDESSYAIKGSIVNSDISDNARIDQSKIADLDDSLNQKVDKVEGKGLSTNDYTTDEQTKLNDIETGAQVNVIEHVFLNDEEILPATVSNQPKSIDLHFNGMTPEQGEKLAGIEAEAQVNIIEGVKLNGTLIEPVQKVVNIEINEFTTEEKEKLATVHENAEENVIEVIKFNGVEQEVDQNKTVNIVQDYTPYENKIETIYVNNVEQPPDNQKAVHITIDPDAFELNVINGAFIPNGNSTEAVNIVNKQLELARIAKTGDVRDLLQTENTYIILDCGSSTEVI